MCTIFLQMTEAPKASRQSDLLKRLSGILKQCRHSDKLDKALHGSGQQMKSPAAMLRRVHPSQCTLLNKERSERVKQMHRKMQSHFGTRDVTEAKLERSSNMQMSQALVKPLPKLKSSDATLVFLGCISGQDLATRLLY
jgi:hypothetical protein